MLGDRIALNKTSIEQLRRAQKLFTVFETRKASMCSDPKAILNGLPNGIKWSYFHAAFSLWNAF